MDERWIDTRRGVGDEDGFDRWITEAILDEGDPASHWLPKLVIE